MNSSNSVECRQANSMGFNKFIPACNRTIDISCSLLALPFLGLGVLAMTVVNGLVSPGPVFFRQERIGFKGRRFKVWKFRTMNVAAETSVHQQHFKCLMNSDAPMVKLDELKDKRLIPGARLLRASGMDELPQILNILSGDMSLVGPRPCLPSEFSEYLPEQRERLNAIPGLTGLWQVSGKNQTTFAEMIRLDIHYARNPSVLLNLKIIFLTPLALANQLWDTFTRRTSTSRTSSVSPAIDRWDLA